MLAKHHLNSYPWNGVRTKREYMSFGTEYCFFLFSNVSFFSKPIGTKAYLSNKRHRPIGIGVQGLADAFILMRYPFESPEAQLLNKQIFETIYYGALEASCDLAKEHGPYETYEGSPVSKGVSIWIKFSSFFFFHLVGHPPCALLATVCVFAPPSIGCPSFSYTLHPQFRLPESYPLRCH